MSDVTDTLDQLIAGETDLDRVVEDFRTRAWPRRTQVDSHDATDLYALDETDPDEEPPGSFAEVADYLARHLIDPDTYLALSEAAAQAMKDAPTPGTPAGAVNERNPE